MLRIEHVLGSRLDPALAERIHELEHQGAVDLLTVPVADVSRHRFRATTQGGTEVAIALPRDQRRHWRVRFAGEALLVAMEAPMDDYLARLGALIRDRRVISSLADADEILL